MPRGYNTALACTSSFYSFFDFSCQQKQKCPKINLEYKSPNDASYWIYVQNKILYICCGVLQLPLLLGCICLVMLFITIVRYSVLFS